MVAAEVQDRGVCSTIRKCTIADSKNHSEHNIRAVMLLFDYLVRSEALK